MMLTRQENDLLTRVGPGTPGGELLRRYWLPVAVAQELSDERPTKFVRVLGEDLVLFKDKSGRIGLLADHCMHRGASLVYGRVEERGIACAYHGWLYDGEGNILETPPERNDAICRNVKIKAYPVQKFVGLIWTYLGPPPAPVIPKYDVWMRKDGRRRIYVQPQLDCNWVQAMENSADPAHLQILHQNTANGGRIPSSTTRGFIDDIERVEFAIEPYGIMKRRFRRDGAPGEAHPLIFPNILRQGDATQIRVPMDDTHTRIFFIRFTPTEDGSLKEEDDPPVEYVKPYKSPPGALHPYVWFDMNHQVQAQDHMAWETQGPIADRTAEHLATSDQGVAIYRKLLKESIECIQQGLDPFGLIRNPDHEMIDTNLDESLEQMKRRGSPRLAVNAGRQI
jgi:5,5'-dehydrodivanillate O-demethylase